MSALGGLNIGGSSRPPRRVPFSGAALVFQRRMRGRRAKLDFAWSFALLGVVMLASAFLTQAWLSAAEYSGPASDVLSRWLTMSMVSCAVIMPIVACALGALAAPPREEFEATQAALLTTLTPLDIVIGRLAASLWPIFSALLTSLAFWLAIQLGWRFWHGPLDGFGPIAAAHFVVFMTVVAFSALSMLVGMRRRPGRSTVRGFACAVAVFVLSVTGLFLANPILANRSNPTNAIEALLFVNPVATVSTALNLDLLRTNWLYDRTVAPEFPFTYPSAVLSTLLFTLMAVACLILASARLRRAYR